MVSFISIHPIKSVYCTAFTKFNKKLPYFILRKNCLWVHQYFLRIKVQNEKDSCYSTSCERQNYVNFETVGFCKSRKCLVRRSHFQTFFDWIYILEDLFINLFNSLWIHHSIGIVYCIINNSNTVMYTHYWNLLIVHTISRFQ